MSKAASSLKQLQWPLLRNEMIQYFKNKPTRCSTVDIEAKLWPRLTSTEKLRSEGYVPALIAKHGEPRKVFFKKEDIDAIAFENADAHISPLFKARLIRIHAGPYIEEVVVDHINVDMVENHLYYLKFKRHVPGQVTEVDVPLTLVGLLGSPAYLQGMQVELATPTVRCEVIGKEMPPPFIVDVSKLQFVEPYNSMYLRSLLPQLPEDGSVRFGRDLDLDSEEVAWTYQAGRAQEKKLDADFVDPNFLKKNGQKMMLNYRNWWPKQH